MRSNKNINPGIHEKEKHYVRPDEGENKYRSIFENSMDAILLTAPEGSILEANPSACRMLGMTEEMICRVGRSGIMDVDDPRLIKGLKERERTGRFYGELTMIRNNGEKFPVELSTAIFRGKDGRLMTSMNIHDISERKVIEKELKELNRKLRSLMQYQEKIREDERARIALNLHDDLGQKLTVINLELAWIRSRIGVQSILVRRKFESLNKLINETIETTRETATILRPPVLSDLGLIPAIEWQLGKLKKQTGIQFIFNCSRRNIRIEENLSLALFRVLQESLTNVIKHSGSEKALVSLDVIRDRIRLVIKDFGRGIAANRISSSKSMGIAGIKERIGAFGGSVEIIGKRGEGTTIIIEVDKKNRKR
ncbi:MAG: PAS domain-containing sensor histidine kinase [Bacteroidota bacterium]